MDTHFIKFENWTPWLTKVASTWNDFERQSAKRFSLKENARYYVKMAFCVMERSSTAVFRPIGKSTEVHFYG